MFTIYGPVSSYSYLVIHIDSKGVKQARILPPIHVEYCHSAGKWTLKSIPFPDRLCNPLHTLSAKFQNIEFPPIKYIF